MKIPHTIRICLQLTTAPNEEAQENILNALNDVTLQAIFELPELNLYDLLIIASVCRRFKQIANKAFQSRYDNGKTMQFGDDFQDAADIEELFRCFGESMTSIDLINNHYISKEFVIHLLIMHCPNVIELAWCADDIQEEIVQHIRPLLENIQMLDITYKANPLILADLFDMNVYYRLEKLTIHTDHLILPHRVNFPHLTEVYFDADDSPALGTIRDFFKCNQQIEKITLNYCRFGFGLENIIRFTPNLTHLILDRYGDDSSSCACFERLCRLETLEVRVFRDSTGYKIPMILRALSDGNVRLKNLLIFNIIANIEESLIYEICQMKSIENLRTEFVDEAQLMQLVTGLDQLKRIEIVSPAINCDSVARALSVAPRLAHASFILQCPPLFPMQVHNAEAFEAIERIQRERNIDVNVELYTYENYQSPDEVPIFGVRHFLHFFVSMFPIFFEFFYLIFFFDFPHFSRFSHFSRFIPHSTNLYHNQYLK